MEIFLQQLLASVLMFTQVYAGCDVFTHNRVADIVFLIDSSGSVHFDNFKKQLRFVSQLASKIPIGPSDNQLGIETFSEEIHHHLSLKDHYKKADLIAFIGNIPYKSGGTHTGEALRYVMSHSFTSKSGGRKEVPHILIVTTDGKSDNEHETLSAADELHTRNITSICIGIGEHVKRKEIAAIASSPDNAVYVHDFNALLSTVLNLTLSKIQQSACQWTQTTKTKTPTMAVKTGLTTLMTTTQSNTVAVRANVTTSSSRSINRSTRSLNQIANARASSTTQHISSANSNEAMFHPFLLEDERIKKAEIGILVLVSMISAGLSICCCHKLFLLFKRKENDNEDEEKNEIQAISSFDTVAYSSKIFPKKFPSCGPIIDFPSSYRSIKDTQW